MSILDQVTPLYTLAQQLGIDPGIMNETTLINTVCREASQLLLEQEQQLEVRDRVYWLLFSSPVDGEELVATSSSNGEGGFILTVTSDNIKLKHTITTEEI